MSAAPAVAGVLKRCGQKHRFVTQDVTGWNFAHRLTESTIRRAGTLQRSLRQRSLLKRMAELPPAPDASSASEPTVQTLLGSHSLPLAVASAKSLMLASGRPLRFLFHDDGTLTDGDVTTLQYHLPGSSVIRRIEADAHAEKALSACPTVHRWRSHSLMALKLIDVALWAPHELIIYVDTDVLFFAEPRELLEAARTLDGINLFNRDIETLYTVPIEAVREELGIPLLECINAGLFVLNRADVRLVLR